MASLILFPILHFVGCLLFFALIQRPLFMAYNKRSDAASLTMGTVADIYRHGYKTDMAVAAYLTAVPWLLAVVHAMAPMVSVTIPLVIYECLMAIAVSLICVADMALYRFWHTKIDASVLVYLRNLKAAFASVSAAYVLVALTVVIVFAAVYLAFTLPAIPVSGINELAPRPSGLGAYAVRMGIGLLQLVLLFLAIRGINSRPNSPSIAYYCKNQYYNHSAINPVYNFIYSLSIKDQYKDKFRFYSDEECSRIFMPMFPTSGTPTRRILNTTRPNILLIIWESLCADYVEAVGGKADVTNNITRLASEGVIFTNVRAGSVRTDRGIVCVLSGIPGQPTTSLIKYTKKLPGLPALPRTLKQLGYHTSVIHGGDLSVLHKSDYYVASGHDRLVGIDTIAAPASAPRCRWGLHDNYMFDYVYDDIVNVESQSQPWMVTFQTLSSHEPFIVPYRRLDHEISNAYAFTDDAFGNFVDRIRRTPAWDNLLIIVVGDHGMNNNDVPLSHHDYSHIPILMVGGAVSGHAVIDTEMSQMDLAATLLGQMDVDHSDFTYSRDVLADTYTYPSSLHSYNCGFVFTDSSGHTDYDLMAETAIEGDDAKRISRGRAIIQYLYADLAKR